MNTMLVLAIIILFAALGLALFEFVGIVQARSKKLTRNSARLVTRGAITGLILAVLLLVLYGVLFVDRLKFLIVLLVASTLFLVGYEFYGIYRARRQGLTKNRSRLITHGLMMFLLGLLLGVILNIILNLIELVRVFD